MGKFFLRQDLLKQGRLNDALADLVRQLNTQSTGSAPESSPYKSSSITVPKLEIVEAMETLDALSGGLKVDLTATEHSDLYEVRWKTATDSDWRSTWAQASNKATFIVQPPMAWEAQMRVRLTPTSPWSDWVTAKGSGDPTPDYEPPTEDIVTYTAPTGVSASATLRGIKVTWSPVLWYGLKGYIIVRNTANDLSGASEVASLGGTIMWTDGSVQAGVTYYYWVCAVHANGYRTDYSGPASATATEALSGDEIPPLSINDSHINWGALREYKTNWKTHLIY